MEGVLRLARSYSRHGLNTLKARVQVRGLQALDMRTAAAREAFAFKRDLVSALGGETDLSPQRRRLIEMVVRAAVLLDHVDAWLFEQESLVNRRTRTLLPVLNQRQSLADHLARLLDRLGLDRVPTKAATLDEYLRWKYGAGTDDLDDATAPQTEASS